MDRQIQSPSPPSTLSASAYLFAGYWLLATTFSHFSADYGFGSIFITWPPAGFALAIVYFWGVRVLPGLLLAALFFRASTAHAALSDAAIFSVATSLQAFAGACAIRFAEKKWVADRMPHRIASWMLICCTFGSLFVPFAEIITLSKTALPYPELAYQWLQLWMSEATGALVGASLTTLYLAGSYRTRANKTYTAILLIVTLCAHIVIIHLWNLSWRASITEDLSRRSYAIESAILGHMNLSLESVRTIAQLADASKSVEGAEFSKFVLPFFERHPGVYAFEWVSRVDPENLNRLKKTLQRRPNNPLSLLTTPLFKTARGQPQNTPHFVISFIEPLAGNETAVGYDITETPGALANLITAIDTGKLSLSEPLTLIQEKGTRQAVVAYFPFYRAGKKLTTPAERRESLVGLAGAVFRLDELLPVAMGTLNLSCIRVRIEDADSLFSEPLFNTARPGEVLTHFSSTRILKLQNQSWRLDTRLTVDALQANRRLADVALPIGSVLITAMLTFIVLLLTGRTAEIERLITLRTKLLQKAISARDDFLLAASHELKTPLTPLRLQVDFLRELATTKRLAEFSQKGDLEGLLTSIGSEVERYGLLVNDLIDFSRFSSNQLILQREPCDIASIANRAVEIFKTDPRKSGYPIELVIHSNATGNWDPLRIQQVLVNLISNAVKYGSSKPIRIEIEKERDVCRISVSDEGIGIAPEDQARIFERFTRAVEIKNYPGLGLGLFIAQEIVHAHSGAITVRSTPGMGSTFTIELPSSEI